MIEYLDALILGVVEGLTEFLPVSSTAHLIISEYLLKLPASNFLNFLTIFIQLGAIAAVPLLYFKRLTSSIAIYRFVTISFIPAVILGLAFDDLLEAMFQGYYFIAFSWIIGGIILVNIDFWMRNTISSCQDVSQQSYAQAIKIGFYQCLAMIPGVSRSGATIVGARLTGLSHQAAIEYSFLLGIPTILGACAKKILDYRADIPQFIDSDHLPILLISFIVSFIVAIVTIRFMVSIVSKYGFKYFGYYRIIAGILLVITLWLNK
ncbi:MAG: undecaprenyl-diphosphate phosphatase [Cytophagaceae bacterium]|nr:undecaprenyl-diphosphate phosphatase [Cytophagaceae bacterium]